MVLGIHTEKVYIETNPKISRPTPRLVHLESNRKHLESERRQDKKRLEPNSRTHASKQQACNCSRKHCPETFYHCCCGLLEQFRNRYFSWNNYIAKKCAFYSHKNIPINFVLVILSRNKHFAIQMLFQSTFIAFLFELTNISQHTAGPMSLVP